MERETSREAGVVGCETERVSEAKAYQATWTFEVFPEKGRLTARGSRRRDQAAIRIRRHGRTWKIFEGAELLADQDAENLFFREFAAHKAKWVKARDFERSLKAMLEDERKEDDREGSGTNE